ncbi:MAG: hypothetical protein FWC16_11215 [Defluviitaleaceae bacterium]|nr:hypothetical protein [Defluviitaleaceae bacterium]MCL2275487.1 hypothetical protein [Defluviitaleaceae bacterium]
MKGKKLFLTIVVMAIITALTIPAIIVMGAGLNTNDEALTQDSYLSANELKWNEVVQLLDVEMSWNELLQTMSENEWEYFVQQATAERSWDDYLLFLSESLKHECGGDSYYVPSYSMYICIEPFWGWADCCANHQPATRTDHIACGFVGVGLQRCTFGTSIRVSYCRNCGNITSTSAPFHDGCGATRIIIPFQDDIDAQSVVPVCSSYQ